MSAIDNITFDSNAYSRLNELALILHQRNQSLLTRPLLSARRITFIRPFNDIPTCQNHINTNDRNQFTLFVYSEDIQTWLWNNNLIPTNLDGIIIFCLSHSDQKYCKDWTRRYTQKVRDVITYNQLERELLLFGMKYIETMRSELRDNQGDQYKINLLNQDYENIRLALMDCFRRAANQPDDDIGIGIQAT